MGVGDAAVKIETTGIDEVLKEMGKMQQLTGDAAQAMLNAGGNVFQKWWITEAMKHGHKKTGDMIKSIGFSKAKDRGSGLQIDIYPQGKGRTGVRNSVKAFVLHHGRNGRRNGKGKINGDEWVKDVVLDATDESNMAMAKVWGQFIATGDVPVVKKLRKGQK